MEFVDQLLNYKPNNFTIIVFIIVVTFIFAKTIRWLIDKTFITHSDKLNVDPTRYKFFKNASSLIVSTLALGAIISFIPALKSLAYTLFAGAGIFVAVLGFAAQAAFANIISGIFLVIFKPFRVGDMIKVGNQGYGIVEDITLRHTIINNFENKRVIIPNSIINSDIIVNDTINDSKVCRFIEIEISYDSDIELASKIFQEEATKHHLCIDTRTPEDISESIPKVIVRMVKLGNSGVTLRAYVWMEFPIRGMEMQSDITKKVKERFSNEGIEIPFPYRTIVYKNDLKNSFKG